MTIPEIIKSLKQHDHFITKLHQSEIELSLTCNLEDNSTYNYARSHFAGYYANLLYEYHTLCTSLTDLEHKEFYDIAKHSFDLIMKSNALYLERLNAEKEKRNE